MKQFLRLAAFVFVLASLASATAAESVDQTVSYLLNYIGHADATFTRNGSTHTPAEAVEHIKAKYEHFKKDIKTPEDFIRLAATKSLLSGKPYTVTPAGGKEQPLADWLREALKAHRASAGS